MAAKHNAPETEIKLSLEGPARARALLLKHRYSIHTPRAFESNTLYDTPARTLRNSKQVLRLRTVAKRAVCTFKGPPQKGRHKTREEIEFLLDNPQAAAAILERLGYQPLFRYEKYRTEYKQPRAPGIVMLDETPIGTFLELEGPPDWIDRAAAQLGFSPDAYITLSYGSLYLAYCSQLNLPATHMVFPPRKAPKHT